MAYNYYLVYFNETKKLDTGINLYADSEEYAKANGAVLLSRITGRELSPADMFVEEDATMQEDEMTTT